MVRLSRTSVARILLLAGRLSLAAIFLVSAYAKLRPVASMPWAVSSVKVSLSLFALQVDAYQLLAPSAVRAVAYSLPFLELLLGLWLLSGISLRLSSAIAALCLVVFLAAMLRAYVLHLGVDCGCFGSGEQIGPRTLIRDSRYLVLALVVMIGAYLLNRKSR